MAFNPFSFFRKKQKTFMVLLTISVMIIFVFSFGPGDLFDSVSAWVNTRQSRGSEVVTLHGKTIYQRDLDQLQIDRELANRFVLGAVRQDPRSVKNHLQGVQRRIDSLPSDNTNRDQFRSVLRSCALRHDPEELLQEVEVRFPRFAPGMKNLPINQRLNLAAQLLQNELNPQANLATLKQLARKPNIFKGDQREIFLSLLGVVALDLRIQEIQPANQDRDKPLLLGGNLEIESLLDFKLWLHQADQLGISLTEADVRKEINRLAGGRDVFRGKSFVQSEVVQQQMGYIRGQRPAGMPQKPKDLLQAVTNEIRVALAKEAILGSGNGLWAYWNECAISRSPATPTPGQFLQFFREQRTTVTVALLPIPVEQKSLFQAIDRKPSEEILRYRFNQYKDKVPDPAERTPGFKVPRRVKAQFISTSPDDPYYRKLAQHIVRGVPSGTHFLAPFSHAIPGTGPLGWACMVGNILSRNPLASAYRSYQFRARMRAEDGMGLGFEVDDNNTRAALELAHMLAGGQSRLAPLATVLAQSGIKGLYAKAASHRVGSALLASAIQTPLVSLGITYPFWHSVSPYQRAIPWIEESSVTRVAEEQIRENLRQLGEDLAQATDTAKANVARESTEKYHLKSQTTELRSVETMENDPVAEEYKDALGRLRGGPDQPPEWEARLFDGKDLYRMVPLDGQSGFWLVKNEPARKRAFDDRETQKLVRHSWLIEQARPLARKQAEQIAQEVTKVRKQAILDFLGQKAVQGLKPFILDNVAQQIKIKGALPGRGTYRPYLEDRRQAMDSAEDWSSEKKTLFRHAPEDLARKLTSMKKPGEAIVFADHPGRRFYVAVLLSRDPQEDLENEFYPAYQHAQKSENPLWNEFLAKRQEEYRKEVLAQLRRASGAKVDEKGEWVIPSNLRRQSDIEE